MLVIHNTTLLSAHALWSSPADRDSPDKQPNDHRAKREIILQDGFFAYKIVKIFLV